MHIICVQYKYNNNKTIYTKYSNNIFKEKQKKNLNNNLSVLERKVCVFQMDTRKKNSTKKV